MHWKKSANQWGFLVKAIVSSDIYKVVAAVLYVSIWVAAYFCTVQNLNWVFFFFIKILNLCSLLLGCIVNLGGGGVSNL